MLYFFFFPFLVHTSPLNGSIHNENEPSFSMSIRILLISAVRARGGITQRRKKNCIPNNPNKENGKELQLQSDGKNTQAKSGFIYHLKIILSLDSLISTLLSLIAERMRLPSIHYLVLQKRDWLFFPLHSHFDKVLYLSAKHFKTQRRELNFALAKKFFFSN